jgi:hypothetical protein
MKTKEPSKRCRHTIAKYCENLFEERLRSTGCDGNSGVLTWTHEEGSTVRARNSVCSSTASQQHQQHQQHQQPFPVPQSMRDCLCPLIIAISPQCGAKRPPARPPARPSVLHSICEPLCGQRAIHTQATAHSRVRDFIQSRNTTRHRFQTGSGRSLKHGRQAGQSVKLATGHHPV